MRIDLMSVRAGNRTGPRLRRRGRGVWTWLSPLLMLLLGLSLPLVASDLVDAFMHKRGYRDGNSRLEALDAWVTSLPNIGSIDLPLIQLDLKFKRWQRLLDKRAEALKTGRLRVSKADFVSGTIRSAGKRAPVVVRLQGSDVGQLQGEKWPLRVHVRRGGHVLDVERFTLRSLQAGGGLTQATLYEHMRLLGISAPRQRFVRLSINGSSRGLMIMEEYFSNELVAAQHRPEGPVLRFGKALLHVSESLAADSDDMEADAVGLGLVDNYRLAPVRVFRLNRWLRESSKRRVVHRAVSLLDGFASARLSADRVFDIPIMARFLAVCEIWGVGELLAWPNLRFYYNPISDRLEPIAYTSGVLARQRSFALPQHRPFSRDLLRDASMRQAYVDALAEVAQEVVRGDITRRLERKIVGWRALLASEYPMVSLDLGSLADRARSLLAAKLQRPALLLARRRSEPDASRSEDQLRLVNPLMVDVEVLSARWRVPVFVAPSPSQKPRIKDKKRARSRGVEGPPRYLPLRWIGTSPLPLTLHSNALDAIVRWRTLGVERPSELGPEAEIELQVRISSGGASQAVLSIPEFVSSPVEVTESSARRNWVHRIEEQANGSRFVRMGPGVHRISAAIRLPAGVGLQLAAGATLVFDPGAGLLVRGEVVAEGTADRPVTLRFAGAPIQAPPSPSPAGALVVLGPSTVRLRHLRVQGPGGKRPLGSRGAGAIVLYQATLHAEDCQFEGATTSAALQLVGGQAVFDRLGVEHCAGDALAIDYAKAEVSASRFTNIGGDAVDIAGSQIELHEIEIQRAGDKGISVGERSEVKIEGLTVLGATIGVAVKDDSKGTLKRGHIVARAAGVAVFAKKRRFGPASLVVTGLEISRARVPLLAQGDCSLEVNGEQVRASKISVRDLLAGELDQAP